MNATAESATTFAETSVLFAVMDDDLPKARRIIADLLPHERKMFAWQLTCLLNMLGEPCQECGDLTPATPSVTKLVTASTPNGTIYAIPELATALDTARVATGLMLPSGDTIKSSRAIRDKLNLRFTSSPKEKPDDSMV